MNHATLSIPFVAILAQDATDCPRCGARMLEGDRIVIGTPCRHEVCPTRWTPTVIAGGAQSCKTTSGRAPVGAWSRRHDVRVMR